MIPVPISVYVKPRAPTFQVGAIPTSSTSLQASKLGPLPKPHFPHLETEAMVMALYWPVLDVMVTCGPYA